MNLQEGYLQKKNQEKSLGHILANDLELGFTLS